MPVDAGQSSFPRPQPAPNLGAMSFIQWLMANWVAAGDVLVPIHEPTTAVNRWGEGTGISADTCSNSVSSVRTCTCDWLVNFLYTAGSSGCAAALGSANMIGYITAFASTLAIPVCGYPSGPVVQPCLTIAFTTDYSENGGISTGTCWASGIACWASRLAQFLPAYVEFGFDLYNFGASPGVPPAANGVAATTYAISQSETYSHQVFFEEFGTGDTWVQAGKSENEGNAIVGLTSCQWVPPMSNHLTGFSPRSSPGQNRSAPLLRLCSRRRLWQRASPHTRTTPPTPPARTARR